MTEKAVKTKAEALPDLDDLLQCPVCYEIPTGQIFQCNEGHHVCGRCKLRLDVCPVCRAFFFGTRNYAMEELIANIRKLRAFKLGGKVTTGNSTPEQQSEAKESTSEENESVNNEEEDAGSRDSVNRTFMEPPKPCSGLFRCLCCKTNPERLPSARLLNHLRYFHSPDLIEGRSDENGEYIQAWQFSTDVGRIVTAVRIGNMGLFFLVIEITLDSVFSWLVMAASPQVAEEFCYTYTLSGNDREAIFSDVVWSVRTCEGFLKKRMRCLSVTGSDAQALLAPSTMSAKLRLRRAPLDVPPHQTQPRAVLRVANRSAAPAPPAPPAHPTHPTHPPPDAVSQDLEPFLQDLQHDVARLSRAFATLGREANALVRSEAEMRARLENSHHILELPPAAPERPQSPPPAEPAPLSRNARRRMRQRLRQAFRENHDPATPAPAVDPAIQTNGRQPSSHNNNSRIPNDHATGQNENSSDRNTVNAPRAQNDQGDRANNNQHIGNMTRADIRAERPSVAPPPVPPPVAAGPASNGNGGRNKKKRRQRR